MRKNKALLLAASFALAMSQHPAHAQKAIFSDGFETSYDGWSASGDMTEIKAIQGSGYGMSRGIKITNRRTPGDGAAAEKGFYLDGGQEYNYSVFVKHGQPKAETFNLRLRWLYPDGVRYESEIIASAEAKPNAWTELSATFAAPQNTVNLTLIITTNSTADFYFDNVEATQNGYFSEMPGIAPAPGDKSLKNVYANHFRVGNILNGSTVNNNTIKALILKEYNSISMENEMKPDATIKQSGSTSENIQAQLNTGAAAILKFCSDNNIAVRGHVLVWHGQSPRWFFTSDLTNPSDPGNTNSVKWASKAVMEKRLETYITNMFKLIKEQYPNLNLYAYDVVNEAVATCNNVWGARCGGYDFKGAGGVDQTAEGNSPWAKIYGDNSFIESAFKYAKAARDQYFPNCKLFYNDYNEWDTPKKNYIINSIIKPLKQKGYLDGMGMQHHIDANNNWNNLQTCTTAISDYAKENVEVQLTEMDVGMKNSNAQAQATRYKQTFDHAIKVNGRNGGKVTAIIIWGPNDANTWRGDDNATLHDNNNNPKAAYTALVDNSTVPQSQWGDGDNPPCCTGTIITPSSSSHPPSSSSATPSSSSVAPSSSSVASSSSSSAAVSSSSRASSSSAESESSSSSEDSSSSSEDITPIAYHSLPIVNSKIPTYYTIKGEPVGSAKPAKPGVYLVKQGSSVRKIVVR